MKAFFKLWTSVPHSKFEKVLLIKKNSHNYKNHFSYQTDRAVQLLLETSADNQHYYCDSLKACLVTTVTSSGPSQSTIKLVATNMIANGKLAGKARAVAMSVHAVANQTHAK